MREYGLHELGFRGLQRFGDRETLDELRGLGADHVRAEQLAAAGVEDGLYEAVRLRERDRLAVGAIGKAADADVAPGGAGRRLSQADAGDLRPAVGAGGNGCGVERLHALDTRQVFHADDPLVARLVRQPGWTDDVADRIQAGLISRQPPVDGDVPLLDARARALEPDAFD